MKIFRVLSSLALIIVLFTYANCGGDPPAPPPVTDVQFDKLIKGTPWKINTATLDGVDKTSDYTGFTLTFSGTKGSPPFNYATAGRPTLSPWKASGTWDFGAAPETQFIRDKGTADELPVTYAVTEATLTVSFTFNGAGYTARTGVVKGAWVFTFGL
jgi:hypothetical protein